LPNGGIGPVGNFFIEKFGFNFAFAYQAVIILHDRNNIKVEGKKL